MKGVILKTDDGIKLYKHRENFIEIEIPYKNE